MVFIDGITLILSHPIQDELSLYHNNNNRCPRMEWEVIPIEGVMDKIPQICMTLFGSSPIGLCRQWFIRDFSVIFSGAKYHKGKIKERYYVLVHVMLSALHTGMSFVSMITAGTCRADRFNLMLVLTCLTSSCVNGVSGAILRKRITRSSDPSELLCEIHKLSTTSFIDSTAK